MVRQFAFQFYLTFGNKVQLDKWELIKFIYSEKATKFCKIFTLFLIGTTKDKSKLETLQNFVAFSECMNFTNKKAENNVLITGLHRM